MPAPPAQALPEHAVRLEIADNRELVRPAEGLRSLTLQPPRGSTRFIRL
jgi:cytochrome P450/NADPH-cytochrome P450 reductase